MGAMEMLRSGSNLATEVWGFGSKGDLVQLRGLCLWTFFCGISARAVKPSVFIFFRVEGGSGTPA